MVKPPKRMEPESVELSKAGRSTSKAFQENSFANYMARKIDGQRQTKGCVLPPDPRQQSTDEKPVGPITLTDKKKAVRFAPDVLDRERTTSSTAKRRQKRPGNSIGMLDMVKRLKSQHGHGYSERRRNSQDEIDANASTTVDGDELEIVLKTPFVAHTIDRETFMENAISTHRQEAITNDRPDLFFLGVVVLVNGYTNPDTETLHRLLHKHGGDLEKYETSRVTHIIAENLSFAKANVYKKNKKPRPVCKPLWITDSVAAHRLLPYRDYLLNDVHKEGASVRPLTNYFLKQFTDAGVTIGAGDHGAVCTDSSKESLPCPSEAAVDDRTPNLTEAHAQTLLTPESIINVSDESIAAAAPLPGLAVKDTGRTDEKYIKGRIRTIGTDPHFLDSFFSSSRLSFIGSYKQRVKTSPTKRVDSLSARNKQRFVMHIDMDSFFCSVVLRSFPQYKDKPVVISHHGIRKTDTAADTRDAISSDSTSECATCNYEARRYGIKKGMYLGQAKQLCKDLVVLHYDFEGFEEVSEQVADIIFLHAAKYDGTVEQVSCDESFLELLLGTDETLLAEDVGRDIRREIEEETQCTATIGIASNKLLAKLATDKVKPNGLLYVSDYRDLLKDLRLRDLHGIGYRLDQKLAAEGFETVQDVWALNNKDDLVRILGKVTGAKLFDLCYGKDDRPVEPAERKSIGAECNYGIRFNGTYGPEYALDCLAKEVEKRMTLVGVKGAKVTLKVKQRKEGAPPPPKFLGHGSCHNLSRSRDTPGVISTRDCTVIRDVCRELYTEMAVKQDDVRGIGIVITKLTSDDAAISDADRKSYGIQNFLVKASNGASEIKQIEDSTVDSAKLTETRKPLGSSPFVIRDVLRRPDDDVDFELPSMSQIHMSQVNQLPSPMRRHATRRIIDATVATKKQKSPKMRTFDGDGLRWKQTNVKRLFQLAAVKTGEAPLHGVEGEQVCLRDFESLPLEMQLQLANNDTCSLGVGANNRKRPKLYSLGQAKVGHVSPSSPFGYDNITGEENYDVIPLFDKMDADEFFRGNVLPLNEYLDTSLPETGIFSVNKFFRAIVAEGRLHDASILLRSIYNRQDGWSNHNFDVIFHAADEAVFEHHKRRLDKAWVCAS